MRVHSRRFMPKGKVVRHVFDNFADDDLGPRHEADCQRIPGAASGAPGAGAAEGSGASEDDAGQTQRAVHAVRDALPGTKRLERDQLLAAVGIGAVGILELVGDRQSPSNGGSPPY